MTGVVLGDVDVKKNKAKNEYINFIRHTGPTACYLFLVNME